MLPITKYNYLKSLRQHYGSLITNNAFYYGKTSFKISKLKCDLNFLKSCNREHLLPTFVRFKIPLTYERYQTAIQNCYREILKNEIKVKKRQLSQLYRICNNLKLRLKSDLDDIIRNQISKIITEIEKEKGTSWVEIHLTKLNKLRDLKRSPSNLKCSTNLPSAIKNYS